MAHQKARARRPHRRLARACPHKPEVERKHRARSEDMTELQDPKFFVPLKFVSTAPRRIDDDMNVVLIFCKRVDSVNRGHMGKS